MKRFLPALKKTYCLFMVLVILLLASARTGFAQSSQTFTSSGSFTVPAGVISVDVEAWGGGGAGGGQSSNQDGGGGGGGGAYSRKNSITVTPGNNYTVVVGAGGAGVTAGNGNAGGDSYFIDISTVLAKGGAGGSRSYGTPPAGGLGGVAANGVGDVKYSGGQGEKGRNSNTGRGGYGGSSAGTGANGWSGPQTWVTATYPTASTPTGGAHGGNGGNADGANGSPGSAPGGGGGGSAEGSNRTGGSGGAGQVVIWWKPTASFTAASQSSGSETGTMIVTAQLSHTSTQDVTIPFTVTGTATGGGTDYTITASPITITAGNTTGTITITVASDALDEDDETVIVTMGIPTNATAYGTTVHTATISDDDPQPTVSFTSASQVSSAETGTMTVTAELSAVSGLPVTVPFTLSGTATDSGTDYTITASPISIPAGSTTGTATITIATDVLVELNETVILTMGSPVNATLGSITEHTATINDDDGPTVTFTSASQSSAGESGTMTITAQLSTTSPYNVTVPFTVSGTATGGGIDYTISSTPLTISSGATSANITITIQTDVMDEDNETVVVTMGVPTYANRGAIDEHTATITDDDPPPTVTLSSSTSNIVENGGIATLTATLNTASSRDVTVNLGFSGTATGSGTDYTPSGSQIVITAGNTYGSVTVTGEDDNYYEGANETIIVDITSVTNGTEDGTQQQTVNILDDENEPMITLSVNPAVISENGGVSTVTVTSSILSTQTVTVYFSFSGTATGGGVDYTASASQVSITPGNLSNSFTITGIDDGDLVGDLTCTVSISSVTNGVESGAQQQTITIADDESASFGSIAVNRTAPENTYTPQQLVENVLVTGCLTASNITFSGSGAQIGYFTKGSSNFDIAEGIILSTGDVADAEGPNTDFGTTTQFGGGGDSDINSISGGTSFDAAVLEFDFVPAGDVIEFNYVFASEEYAEFVEEQYNDAFAFLLSGPGITGTKNIALIPSTSTAVAINTVHGQGYSYVTNYPSELQALVASPSGYGHPWSWVQDNTNGGATYNGQTGYFRISATTNSYSPENEGYYVDNGHYLNDNLYNAQGKILIQYVNGNGSLEMEFDGRTSLLTASHPVTPCATYHIKIVVADVADQKWDSGVFLEGRSFTSNEVQISSQIEGISGDADDMYEGCDGSYIRFQRAPGADNNVVLTFPIIISGTATNGVDFIYTDSGGNIIGDGTFPTEATLGIGVNYVDYYYKAQSDGVIEGNETILFKVNNSCPCDVTPTYYEKTVTIIDVPQIVTSTTEVIQCQAAGNPVATITVNMENGLNAEDYEFSIDGGAFQSGNVFTITAAQPDGSDIVGTSHYITVRDQYSCNEVTEYNIIIPDIAPFDADAGEDITMCEGQTGIQLNGSGGIYYTWSGTGAAYLSSTTVANPTVSSAIPAGTYTFTLTAQDQPGASPACQGTDEMVLTVNQKPTVSVTADDYAVCTGTPVQLTASVTNGGSNPAYLWNPTTGLSSATISNPVYTPSVTSYLAQSFSVTVTGDNGCPASASSSTIEVFPEPVVTTTNITNASCSSSADGSATVSASSPGTSPAPSFTYQWDAAAGNQTGATASNLAPGTYTVTVTHVGQGCSKAHNVTVGSNPDTTPPTAVCQNISVTLDGTGNATITPQDIDNGSSDNCTASGSLVLSLDKTTFNSSNIGANTVTLTVTDAANNTSTCTATVTVSFPANCNITGSRTIWKEEFPDANGTMDDPQGDWTTSVNSTNFSVQSNVMRAVNQSGASTWTSESIDIRSWTNLNIKVDTWETGTIDADDYILFEYSVNGGAYQSFANNGSIYNDYGGSSSSPVYACTNVPDGDNVVIRITVKENSSEYHYFDNVHLTGDPAMEATAVVTNVSCNGGSDGAIDVTVTKGVSPYTYAWTTSNGSGLNPTAPDQTELTAGTYNLVVTDNVGVSSDPFVFTVTEPAAEPALQQLAVSDATSCIPVTGNVSFTITNSQSGVVYELRNTEGDPLSPAVTATGTGSNLNLTILQANVPASDTNYQVMAKTASGCDSLYMTDPAVLTVYDTSAPTGSSPQSFCSSATPRISDISVTGSNIIWYNAPVGGSILPGTTLLVDGNTYYASQTENGCESQSRLAVTVTVTSTPTILTVTHGTVCGTGTSTIYATASAGTIDWYSAQTGGSLLASGTTSYTTPTLSTPGKVSYWVEAVNNGCLTPTRSEVYVNVYVLPAITPGSNPIVCKGVTTASLAYSGAAGAPNQYSLDFDGTAEGFGFVDVTNAALSASPITVTVPAGALAGTYNAVLTVRNSTHGCTSINYPVTVTVVQVAVSGTPVDVSCSGYSNGEIDITVSGGTGPYTYAWTTLDGSGLNPTAEDQTGLTEGTYNVTVTDVNSCQATGEYTVSNLPDNTDPEINFNNPLDDIIIAVTSSESATDVPVDFAAFDDGSGARDINPGATDNCTVTVFTYTQTGATTISSPGTGINTIGLQNFNLGETTITWNAADGSANPAGAKVQKVYAARENQFVLTCPEDDDLGCNPTGFPITNPTYTLPSWLQTLIDNSILTLDTGLVTTLDTPSGTECEVTRTRTYEVTFDIKYNGNIIATVTRECTQTYTYILDTEDPVASCTTNKNVTVDPGECNYTHGDTNWDATATDNCDTSPALSYVLTGATTGSGPSLNGVSFNTGVTTVTWTATDDCGNSDECSFTVTVGENLFLSVQPQNQTVCEGQNATFSVTASAISGTPTYQWQVNTGSGFGDISGANSSSLTITSVTTGMSAYQYQVIVTGPCGVDEITSGAATLTVNPNLPVSVSIAADPGNTICDGTSVTFTATPVNGGSSPSYQWKKNGSDVGTNSITYTDATLANGDVITVELTSNATCATGSPATSNSIAMTVNPNLPVSVSIAADPGNTICEGTSVTFTATPVNGGGSPSYQWKKNGSDVGTSSTTYTDAALANGDVITVELTSNATCATGSPATSNQITMTVNPNLPVSVSIAADPGNTICDGTSVTFTATPTNGGSSPSYQWKKNGSDVGTNSTTYTDAALANGDVITVVLTSNATCATGSPATSNQITMTVNPNLPVSVSIAADPGHTVCEGTSVTFTATPTNGGSSPSYQWKKNGSDVGTNSATYTDAALANGDVITVVLTSNATCATGSPATSSGITMVVAPPTVGGSISGGTSVCYGTNSTLLTLSGHTGSVVKWQYSTDGSNWTDISNTNTTYTATNLAVATQYRAVVQSGTCSSVNSDPATITIDETDPVISNCPENITVNVEPGLCSANVNWTAPTASDNCEVASFVSDYGPGDSFATGTTTVTYTATDTNGNTAVCSFTVTVSDNIAPVISSCPANTTVSTLNDVPDAETTAGGIGASDNCGISTVSHNDVTSLSCPRTITRTYTVTDINGNQTTCQQVITVTNAPCIDGSLCTGTLADNLITGSPTSGTGQLYSQTVPVCSNTTYEIKLTGVSGTSPFDFDVTLDGDVVNNNAMYNNGSTYGFTFKTGPSASTVALVLRNNDANSLTVSAISFAHCGPEVTAAITDLPVCAGASAELTATVTGSGSYVYQWQESSDGGTNWTDLVENSPNVTGTATTVLGFNTWVEGNLYRIVVSETSSGLDDEDCRIASNTLSVTPSDTEAPVYQEAFKNSIDPVHTGGNYIYTICDNGTNTLTLLALDATDVVDNCSAFGDLIMTYSITNGINNVTNETGDASNYDFPVGTSSVTYQAEDENGNGSSFSFTVVVNENPVLTNISTDGTISADGSGYKPYQGSQHTYTVDSGTAEPGSDYEWKVLDKDDTELTADNANTYSINTTNPAAVIITWGSSIPTSGNDYKIVVRKTNSSGCYTEAEFSVVILENTFNATVVDAGDECQSGDTGTSVASWTINKTGGASNWSFDYEIKVGPTTEYSASGVLVSGASTSIEYIVSNQAGVDKTYTFIISNVYDEFNTPETNLTDNEDTVTLWGVPNTSEITTD
ncbi:MAG: choice-of-anchor L domain-containing protein [Prolixibacteraceae bacterium]|jgi:hypothetical protein|nr:choice-of-anchor L domain-containing protein [Prolixibacteraceae bacterium]